MRPRKIVNGVNGKSWELGAYQVPYDVVIQLTTDFGSIGHRQRALRVDWKW